MKTSLLILACSLVAITAMGEPPTQAPHAASGTPPSDPLILFQFNQADNLQGWVIQDDGVMGGLSKGRVHLNEAGNALFSGDVSLENNGGFSSVQAGFDPIDVTAYRTIRLHLKGDAKNYQIRVESEPRARHGYAYNFETSGGWEEIVIPFDKMYAIHHGDRLDLPNYPGRQLSHIQILIGNKTVESFELILDKIWVE